MNMFAVLAVQQLAERVFCLWYSAGTWLHCRCLAAGPPDRCFTSALTVRLWTWRRWLDILFLCCAFAFLHWTNKTWTGCEVLIIYQQHRATAGPAQGAVPVPAVIPWFDLRGRFFVEVWSFLCFDAVPDLCFPLGLEMEKKMAILHNSDRKTTFSEFNLNPGFTLLNNNWNFQHEILYWAWKGKEVLAYTIHIDYLIVILIQASGSSCISWNEKSSLVNVVFEVPGGWTNRRRAASIL